ncbi:EcsC family protein [Paenibacillus sp. GP183]|jgi:hypothetical protein|uniref:EcsC family protein n=1 Tax=Paenibacillus sp. GP183 TaxID=1882751 RepID=UPI00089864E4|nr:EcsC family protein [Paenibacillus sp. GP183]SED13096.1 EcsC protein family protein [Paenibacillus sp. GP183]
MNLDQQTTEKLLNWAYKKAVYGFPKTKSAKELADEYLRRSGTLEEKVNSLILWQTTKSAASGFLTGLGGLPTLPFSVPASILSSLCIQLRLVASIACMGGYDVNCDEVKVLSFACLCGNGAKDILTKAGLKLGAKLTQRMLSQLSREALKQVNAAVGVKLLAKVGQSAAVNMTKAVPLFGSFASAAFDAVSTQVIGKAAKAIFLH